MKARLIERDESGVRVCEIALTEAEFLIGRGSDCNLRLADPDISRHHCLIRSSADETVVLDLGSSNGTYVNGQRVRSQAVLHTGDELQVGTCRFTVDLGDQAWADLSPAAGADPGATTLRRLPKATPPHEERKEEGHPRGGADGPGGPAELESR